MSAFSVSSTTISLNSSSPLIHSLQNFWPFTSISSPSLSTAMEPLWLHPSLARESSRIALRSQHLQSSTTPAAAPPIEQQKLFDCSRPILTFYRVGFTTSHAAGSLKISTSWLMPSRALPCWWTVAASRVTRFKMATQNPFSSSFHLNANHGGEIFSLRVQFSIFPYEFVLCQYLYSKWKSLWFAHSDAVFFRIIETPLFTVSSSLSVRQGKN